MYHIIDISVGNVSPHVQGGEKHMFLRNTNVFVVIPCTSLKLVICTLYVNIVFIVIWRLSYKMLLVSFAQRITDSQSARDL